jgi:uncharacterized membrane protein YjgN (DUF898 family)
MRINSTGILSIWKKNGEIKMKNDEQLKTYLYVLLFFATITFISFFLTEPKKLTKEEMYQSVKDSVSDIQIQNELDSVYIFNHSKIK